MLLEKLKNDERYYMLLTYGIDIIMKYMKMEKYF